MTLLEWALFSGIDRCINRSHWSYMHTTSKFKFDLAAIFIIIIIIFIIVVVVVIVVIIIIKMPRSRGSGILNTPTAKKAGQVRAVQGKYISMTKRGRCRRLQNWIKDDFYW